MEISQKGSRYQPYRDARDRPSSQFGGLAQNVEGVANDPKGKGKKGTQKGDAGRGGKSGLFQDRSTTECVYYMKPSGCNRGGTCSYNHPVLPGKCLNCGSEGHKAANCDRPRKSNPKGQGSSTNPKGSGTSAGTKGSRTSADMKGSGTGEKGSGKNGGRQSEKPKAKAKASAKQACAPEEQPTDAVAQIASVCDQTKVSSTAFVWSVNWHKDDVVTEPLEAETK
eukprot:6472162-Amphidinium_carterae.1